MAEISKSIGRCYGGDGTGHRRFKLFQQSRLSSAEQLLQSNHEIDASDRSDLEVRWKKKDGTKS